MKAALEKQSWETRVKALVPFPEVLTMMSEKLDWTKKLGDAFLAQKKDVMDTVQRLRRMTLEAGNLKSTKEQELSLKFELPFGGNQQTDWTLKLVYFVTRF